MAVTKKQIKNLIPAGKGDIRNPKGRGKGVLNSKTRLNRMLELVQLKRNPVTGESEDFTIMEQMDMAIISKALKGCLASYKEILDRTEGKAEQKVDVTSDGEKIMTVFQLDKRFEKEDC